MKYLLIVLLMTASAFAHDPNDVVSAENRVDVSVDGNIMVVTVLLTDEQLFVYQRTNPMTDIINSIKKVMQRLPDGSRKEFFPSEIIHFYSNRNPGFSVGTPDIS